MSSSGLGALAALLAGASMGGPDGPLGLEDLLGSLGGPGGPNVRKLGVSGTTATAEYDLEIKTNGGEVVEEAHVKGAFVSILMRLGAGYPMAMEAASQIAPKVAEEFATYGDNGSVLPQGLLLALDDPDGHVFVLRCEKHLRISEPFFEALCSRMATMEVKPAIIDLTVGEGTELTSTLLVATNDGLEPLEVELDLCDGFGWCCTPEERATPLKVPVVIDQETGKHTVAHDLIVYPEDDLPIALAIFATLQKMVDQMHSCKDDTGCDQHPDATASEDPGPDDQDAPVIDDGVEPGSWHEGEDEPVIGDPPENDEPPTPDEE